MLNFLKANPARVFAAVTALLVLLGAYGIDLPQEAWLGLVAAVLVRHPDVLLLVGLVAAVLALFGGEVVQRSSDAKVEAALWTDPLEAGAHEAPAADVPGSA